MAKELKDMDFNDLVEETSARCLSELLIKGGPGLKNAIHSALWLAITWSNERSK